MAGSGDRGSQNPQTSDDISAILARLHWRTVSLLQVLGINSLKSVTPPLEDLVGEGIEGSDVDDRIVTLHTARYSVVFDLQRTGKVVWLHSAEPYRLAPGAMPTVRLITDGGAIDLTEPAKSKRITVVLRDRPK